MLDHVLEQVREQEIFSREDTPTEQRVLAGFLYHTGLSFRRIKPFVEVCHIMVHDWYHRLKHLFNPDRDRLPPVTVDETKLEIEDEEVYVWAAVDVDTFEVLHVDVSSTRSSLDVLLFLNEVLKHCRGQPVILADRGEWYDWPLNLLECEAKRENWGDRSLIEAWFGVLKFRTLLFRHRFPHYSSQESTRSWLTSFAALHNAMLQSQHPSSQRQ